MSYLRIPRAKAARLAQLEHDAFMARAEASAPKCRLKWIEAARDAANLKLAILRADERMAEFYLNRIVKSWKRAARCEDVRV